MEASRRIETHQDGRSVELPVFDGEHVAPDRKLFEEWLQSALAREDAGIDLGDIYLRPVKAAIPIRWPFAHLEEAGLGHHGIGTYTDRSPVPNHRYLIVEDADGQRYAGEDFEKGAWIGGRREADLYKRIRAEVDSSHWCVNVSICSLKATGALQWSPRVRIPFPENLRGEDCDIRLFGNKLGATRVHNAALTALLNEHFGRPVQMVRLDEMVWEGDEALPESVMTRVWGNDGAPLHLLSEESMALAEQKAVDQMGEEKASRLPLVRGDLIW